jgi:hypothetical protein
MGFTILPGGGTVNSLPGIWTILADSGIREQVTESGPSATVVFQTAWSNHYTFVASLLGQWTGTPPSTFSYIGPFAYPVGGTTSLMCTSVTSIEGQGKYIPDPVAGLPWLTRTRAIVTAQFTRPPWQPAANGGYFKASFHAAGQFLSLPDGALHYGTSSGPPVANGQAQLIVPQAEISITRYRMPFIPDFIMVPLIGTVNNSAFQILNNSYPIGSLLFATGNTDTEADVFGNITYTVEYKFLYNPIGWNNLLNPNGTSGFVPVVDGNGNSPYGPANFNVLP